MINHCDIQDLAVGSPTSSIEEKLDEQQYSIDTMAKKSKIDCARYGNVYIYFANNIVKCIDLDFHGFEKYMITLDELANWTRNDWLSLAEAKVGGLKKYGTLSN